MKRIHLCLLTIMLLPKLAAAQDFITEGSVTAGYRFADVADRLGSAEIAQLDALEFHADVDQTDIGSIKRGQRVAIALDAFPDRRFRGAVDEITMSNIEESSGRVRYKVRVALEKSDAPVRLGMTGTADCILARKEDILTLPSAPLAQEAP